MIEAGTPAEGEVARGVHEGSDRVECPVCAIQDGLPWIRQDGWQIVRCASCDLAMTWPRPSAEALARAYSGLEYYRSRDMDADEWQIHVLRAREILERSPVSVRRVLDFGAGVGHLVAALRSLGVDAVGVEPSVAGRERARRRYGVDLLETLPEAGSIAAPDLVVLLHSLEHVPDPVAVLRSLAAHLAPGGAVFIEVPNAASFEMWFAERRRQILDLPVHLYHFTPVSLSRIVQSAGLRVTDVRLTNPDWLERVLARRAKGSASVENAVVTGGEVRASTSLRRTWRSRVLPWIRSRSPGWKFQLVAQGLA